MRNSTKDQQIANQQLALTKLQDELASAKADLATAKADIARAAEAERTLKLSLADAEARYAAAELQAVELREAAAEDAATRVSLQIDLGNEHGLRTDWQIAAIVGWGVVAFVALCWMFG